MQLTNVEQLEQTLQEAKAIVPGIQAAAVVSTDGLTIAGALPPDLDEERFVAMSAALLDVGQRTARELDMGSLEQMYMRSQNGYMIVIPAGPEAVLAAILEKEAKLGLVFLNLRRFAEQVAQALSGG
ncbi:MAG: hypothetical protein D6723_02925 [Acidobacteria bacterium]|nr:MAG: hypothetical protein D6723_02925 [Acidobacteriota bacterium]